ncbi:MAG: glycoside hydrolase family 28 protein [Lachnospiraceae bacterium]|nr:glycoside hydrolase family 28 protein [Lachnospiraceae bacterium]
MIRAQCEEVACKESECERTGCKNAASQNAGICENRRLESDLLKLRTKAAKKRLDVTKAPYNAVGDGKTMNTRRLQQALDDCREDEEVYLPRGSYLTGALRLHSNTELYLEEGAVLQGTDVVADYLPKIKSRFEGIENESYSSLLNMGELDHEGGYSCQNVVIRGKGTIASGGRILAERVIALETEYLKDYLAELGDRIKECEKPETIPGRVRPRLIQMSNCQNVVISGITLKNGASWNVHMIYSDNIVTNNCTFISENVWNGDGWDPDSSTNCTLFGCTFYTGDDSVAIKSGKNPEGNLINRPTKHIRIFDCKCALGHGIAVGSEMSGGIEDVKIWDCDMRNSLCGIEIKGTGKRGGYVRDIQVRDCKVSRIMFHSVAYNDDGIGAKKPPVFENCIFEGLQITGSCYDNHTKERRTCDVIELCGFEKPGHELKNIVFREISLGEKGQRSKQTISLGVCEDITFEKIRTMN